MLASLALLPVPTLAKPLYTLVHAQLSPAEQMLAQSVQGLANRKGANVWLETGGIQALLLQDLQKERQVESLRDPWDLVRQFRSTIKGAVVYRLGDGSVNIATSLCGILDAVAVEASLVSTLPQLGLPVLADARQLTEAQVTERYSRKFGRGIVIEQGVDKPGHLRDFAIKHRARTIATRDNQFRTQTIAAAGPTPLVFGWGEDEFDWVGKLSRAGASGVAADWCVNLSALEELPAHRPLNALRAQWNLPTESTKKKVAFVMSDGDNIQWLTGGFATDPKWFGSPLRGSFPITWEVSPLLATYAPRVLEYLYRKATPKDDFVAGPGLPGYCFPSQLPNREAMALASDRWLRLSGLDTVTFLNSNDGTMADLAPWMRLKSVKQAIYKDYSPYHRRAGEVQWIEGKPVKAYTTLLWEGLVPTEQLIREIRESTSHRILINIHAWSYGSGAGPLGEVKRVLDALGDQIQPVTAHELFQGLSPKPHNQPRS